MTGSGPQRGGVRRLAPLLPLALWLALAGAVEAAQGVRHRDWTASCRGDGSGLCVAETAARRQGDTAMLQVTRDAEGLVREIILLTGAAGLAEDAPLSLGIDGKAPLALRHPSAVGRGESGRYRLQDATLVKKLVAQMKAGRRLRVGYRDPAGEARSAEFSLMGLTAALRSFQRGAPGAGPQGPPDLYPPPQDDGRPETRTQAKQGDAVFTPAGEAPPIGGCYEHRRIHDDKGYFIGWSSRNRC